MEGGGGNVLPSASQRPQHVLRRSRRCPAVPHALAKPLQIGHAGRPLLRAAEPLDHVPGHLGRLLDELHAHRVVRFVLDVLENTEPALALDKRLRGLVTRVIYPCPSPTSKGTLVIPTYDGTIMVGPTATSAADLRPQTHFICLPHP